MDTAQHTPGPWIRSRNIDNSPDIHVLAEDGALIATVSAMVSFNPLIQDSEEMKANARLIASAPDLLAALETAVAQFDSTVRALTLKQTVSISSLQNCAASARATIEKARGL